MGSCSPINVELERNLETMFADNNQKYAIDIEKDSKRVFFGTVEWYIKNHTDLLDSTEINISNIETYMN